MLGFLFKNKDRAIALLLRDTLFSYQRIYEQHGLEFLKRFLQRAASDYSEPKRFGGGGFTKFSFNTELSDFYFMGLLDPKYAPGGENGLQIQAHGEGPYYGFALNIGLADKKLFVSANSTALRRATDRASNMANFLENEGVLNLTM